MKPYAKKQLYNFFNHYFSNATYAAFNFFQYHGGLNGNTFQQKRINSMKYLLFIITLSLSTSVFAHGYILKSRAKLCAQGINHNCGPVTWEPQSVEGSDRFPSTGPADGTLAAAGNLRWGALNEQTPTRWHRVDMLPGTNTFDWQFTANHVTNDWRYFITKQDWDQTQPLTRDTFELAPFCSVSGNHQQPPFQVSHTCNVPVRSGYQIILGVWDVGDTAASFYNVIDVQMPDNDTPSPISELKDIGDINPSSDLHTGDIVRLRLFTAQGELIDQAIEMNIANDEQGKMNTWPKLFAESINTQNTELEAGIKDTEGNIVPVFGKNDVFTDISSAITRIEIDIDIDLAEVSASLDINLHQTTFSAGEPMQLVFDTMADPVMSLTAELFFQGARIGFKEASLSSSTQLQLDIQDPQAGSYQLIIIGETADHQHIVQENITVNVFDPVDPVDPVDPANPTDFVYPDNIGSYIAGDLIRGQDGNTYKCLVANWCNGSRTYYAPGLGLSWGSAWVIISEGPAPAVETEFTYPNGRGQYQQGTIVKGSDNNLYRCDIPGWCNSQSSFYYAPATGSAWSSAWTPR